MSVWDLTMEYMASRKVVSYDKFVPFFLASVGAHIVNCHNTGMVSDYPHFYTRAGRILNCRLHLLSVAPPGWSKTYFIDEFMDEDVGLLQNTAISCESCGEMTKNGLFGGWSSDKDDSRTLGAAERHKTGILGFEEWMVMSKVGAQSHSSTMEEQQLRFLDSGRVGNKIGTQKDEIKYRSQATIWAGTQAERFDVTSGMARRFLLINMCPDRATMVAMKQAHRDTIGIPPDMKRINRIRAEFSKMWEDMRMVKLSLSDQYEDYRDRLAADHLIQDQLDRLAIGYCLLKYYRRQVDFIVLLDDYLKKLMKKSVEMRADCLGGTQEAVVFQLLKAGPQPLTVLKQSLMGFGVSYPRATRLLDGMMIGKRISYQVTHVDGVKRPVTMVDLVRDYE